MTDKQTLDDWLLEYLSNDEEYLSSAKVEQQETYKVYRAILGAVGKTIDHENVYPLLVASNSMSKTIIETAIRELAKTLPQAKRVKVSLIH
jgi:hypothetical protein